MNIAEIRKKYPQYDDLSDEQLARGLHSKFYSDMDFGEFSNKIGLNSAKLPQVSDEARAQIAQNIKNYEDKQANALVNNELVRSGVALSQGIANAGLNPAKYVAEAFGVEMKPLKPETAAERALEKAGEYGYDAAVGAALGAGAKAKGLLGQGKGKISKVARALLAPATGEAVATASTGGLLEGVTNPESTAGKVLANLVGGVAGGGLYGAINGPLRTKLVRSGLENIVQDTDSLRQVRRAAKFDDDVATSITNQAAGVAEDINQKSFKALEKELNGMGPQSRYENVRKVFQDFVNANKGNKIKRKWDDLPRLNPYQKKQYKKALQEGLDLADYGTQAGELGHLLTTRSVLDDAINKSYIQEFPAKKATKETAKLTELRKKLDELLSKTGVKEMDREFKLYKGFEDAYQTGLKYQPSGRKNVVLDDLLNAGGNEEEALYARIGMKQGLFDAITNNITPEQNFSKYAKGFQNVLRKVSPEGDNLIADLAKNERDYSRLAKLTNTAENTLTTPEAARFFGREQLEGKGSMIGAALDSILGRLNRGFYTDNAQKLLNGNGAMVEILQNPEYLQRLLNATKGSLTAAERQALINRLEE